jgi:hypothetical protein
MKRDIKLLTRAAEMAMDRLDNPRHRAIAGNYRLHAMLEVSGRWKEIFVPELTVEEPFYRFSRPNQLLELKGAQAVQSFYESLSASGTTVMLLEQEELTVDDWGFGSEALYITYMMGDSARMRGHPDADPAKRYTERRWVCMMWPYDQNARMIGERVYPAHTSTLEECSEDEFWTLEQVQDAFAPSIAEAQEKLKQPKFA